MTTNSLSEITYRDPKTLRPHPENRRIFGQPKDSPSYPDVLASIGKHGIQEPLILLDDGTILSGNMRRDCALDMSLPTVPVRIHSGFATYMEQVEYVVAANAERRQFTKRQIASAYERLKALAIEEGGAKKNRGRPKKATEPQAGTSPNEKGMKTRDRAAKHLKVGRETAEACVEVFKPDVPAVVQQAVDTDKVPATVVAQALKAERKRQGGKLRDEAAVVEAVAQATKPASLEARIDEAYAKLEKLLYEAAKANPPEDWTAKLAAVLKGVAFAWKASSARLAPPPPTTSPANGGPPKNPTHAGSGRSSLGK